MIMISLTALNKPNLSYISSTQSARTFKGNPFLYFQFEDLKAFQLCRGKQSELDVFQKCCSYKHNTNLYWAQIFLLEYLETSPYEF